MNDAAEKPKAAAPNSFRLVATLAGIAMMSGLLVATVYQVTLEPIRENRRKALEDAVFKVLPDATSRKNFLLDETGLTPLSDENISQANVYAGYNDQGVLAGVAMEGAARGYQDVVKVLYGYLPEREVIIGFTVLQSSETPGLGDRVETDPDFLANFNPLDAKLNEAGTALANEIVTVKSGKKTDPWQIDAISGATITSAAIGQALQSSASEMLPRLHKNKDMLMAEAPTIPQPEDKAP
ncbi:MAG: FMN-binding protein [Opitutales bacterium]